MSLPAEIRQLYKHTGPFATAYFDGSRTTEQGQREVDLRWRALRTELEQAGAGQTLAVLDDAVNSDLSTGGRHGHLVVAAADEVLLDEITEEPPPRDYARWAPLPHLMPFLARRSEVVPHVVVLADRTGANLYVNPGHLPSKLEQATPESLTGGGQPPIHKTGRDTWAERHFQNRVDNSWAENASDVADSVSQHVSEIGAQLVLVAGDVRARALVMEAVAERVPANVDINETAAGGRADGAALEPIEQALHDAILRIRWRHRRAVLEKLRQGVGRGDYAVTGFEPVLDALRGGQVETLVISDDPSSTESAWIGEEPLQLARDREQLTQFGVTAPVQDRLDAALIRAVAGSGADLLVTPNAHAYLDGGLGATLRFPLTPARQNGHG
ncbi:MAG: Vms1/Ankzf1 family peptidyl-tRNA hydrolase [Jatrophihabitantaceae bacterium]